MYNHEPENYECPFCPLINGKDFGFNKQEDIVFKNRDTTAFVSPKWWINNPGHVIVVPNRHFENIYDIPNRDISEVYKTVKKISIAIKTAYKCDGISTRQHNEPDGNQDVWHLHIHVFPRYKEDKLYQNHNNKKWVTVKERRRYVELLKSYFLLH